MTKLNKKMGWIIVSAIWILISILIATQNRQQIDTFLILNIPLIIGWGTWLVKHGEIKQ